ncbi:Modular serine protease [Frankliniella fusca]|uniref:Modular serine protease n=1 Tax=Frankliniella fusca TaxID=407009 RepID=A0AAE1H4R1_9NEOP|nr:Modular serine protease [Frankliniella fusca]
MARPPHVHVVAFLLASLALLSCWPTDAREWQSAALNRTVRQVWSDCSFRCQSGSCIETDRVCDGKRDCDDGSDETANTCSSNTVCPGLSFHCDYGACVDADARCNGVTDCADGSDEHPRVCNPGHNKGPGQGGQGQGGASNRPGNGNGNRPTGSGGGGNRPPAVGLNNNGAGQSSLNGGCRLDEYRCSNGQCVDKTVVCDGRKDCKDASDETYTQCYSVKCPSYSFRCAYGGCIDRDLRCDGTENCADGSDEQQCEGGGGGQRPPSGTGTGTGVGTAAPRPTPRPTQRPPQTQRPSQQTQRPRPTQAPATGSGAADGPQCRLPARLQGGSYQVEGCADGDRSGPCRGAPNTPVPHSTVLRYTCDPGYQLSADNNFTFCLSGKWEPTPPTCAKICPALISTSVDLECTDREGKPVRCDKGQLPGTRAKLQCKPSYRFPVGAIPDYDAVNCQPDGTWDWPLFKCIPECGVAIGKGQTLIVHGSDANIGDFPWHAGIYDKEQKEGITQVCGGTLVLPNLVVSAAHCFYDDGIEKEMPPSRYKVAVGKYFRDWDARERGAVQKTDVQRIHLPTRYRGKSRNYADDIALVQLTAHVTISAVVMPICMDWLGSTLAGLRKGDVGTVVGWGRTGDRNPSATLLSARLPFVPFDDCINGIPETFRPFITSDKFCAGNINGSSVAKGDSGGGLAFKDSTTQAWFLRGIVSAGVPNSLTYSAFTNVDNHKEWMSQIQEWKGMEKREQIETNFCQNSKIY